MGAVSTSPGDSMIVLVVRLLQQLMDFSWQEQDDLHVVYSNNSNDNNTAAS